MYDPKPNPLCPDPQLGTRKGWKFCPSCGGVKPPGHLHGDDLDGMTADELRALIRVLRPAPKRGR